MTDTTDALTIAPALRLLDWYQSMGVDAALGAEPINWLARGAIKPGADFLMPRTVEVARRAASGPARPPDAASARTARQPSPPPAEPQSERRTVPSVAAPQSPNPSVRAFVATAPDAAVAAARKAAAGAATLDALAEALSTFDGCGLKATAKNLCFYRGAAHARLMIVGEAPGREDDLAGAPFNGAAGELLEKMLVAIGLTSAACHLSNAVYWRPPGNRHPTPHELDVCQPFLERQVALVRPDILLLLGAAAARQVMDTSDGIMRVRGKWRAQEIGGHPVRAIASLAPTYLLKSPLAKQNAWRDFLAIKAALAK